MDTSYLIFDRLEGCFGPTIAIKDRKTSNFLFKHDLTARCNVKFSSGHDILGLEKYLQSIEAEETEFENKRSLGDF